MNAGVLRVLLRVLAAPAFFIGVIAGRAEGLTLDALEDDGSVSAASELASPRTTHFPTLSAIGGGRSFEVRKTSAGAGVTRLEVVGSTLGYTQGAHTGIGSVTWDGDAVAGTANPTGLGGLDLTQDGGDAFTFGLIFFDYPFNEPIQLTLRVYDAGTPNGSRYSEVTVTVNEQWSGAAPFEMVLPFSLFAATGAGSIQGPAGGVFPTNAVLGPGGGADFSSVGAVTLTFNGSQNGRAPDMILSSIRTNGYCKLVPNSAGQVVDECGVCLDDAEAHRGRDQCGVCFAGPPGYSYEGQASFDGCGVCPSEEAWLFPDGTRDGCGTCLSGPAGYSYINTRDACGVCGGSVTDTVECVEDDDCELIPPTGEIRAFERRLLRKASILRARFRADQARWKRNGCTGPFASVERKVAAAFTRISKQGRAIFRRGIEVCGDSCVTVSYAAEVESLQPEFKSLEFQTSRAASMVKRCYQRRGIRSTSTSGRRVGETITEVREGITQLIKDCRRSQVCPGS